MKQSVLSRNSSEFTEHEVKLSSSLFAVVLSSVCASASLAADFAFKPDDRVVLLGGTFFERAQRYGHLESELTAAAPAGVIFRNLGWCGDTVWAESRGIFDRPDAGYQRMIKQVRDLKPTVLIIGYGANEAFAGSAGLSRFEQQYNKLLDDLATTKARVALVSPTPVVRKPAPLPAPTKTNQNRAIYTEAIAKIADARGATFVNVFDPLLADSASGKFAAMTDNGLHYNKAGYRVVSKVFVDALAGSQRTLLVSDKARELIVTKNMYFFHHWRPQNITYLFLFRKHEQGNNAKEVTEFLELVKQKDVEIKKALTSKAKG